MLAGPIRTVVGGRLVRDEVQLAQRLTGRQVAGGGVCAHCTSEFAELTEVELMLVRLFLGHVTQVVLGGLAVLGRPHERLAGVRVGALHDDHVAPTLVLDVVLDRDDLGFFTQWRNGCQSHDGSLLRS